nr:T9SS type A sorting domain-containing protein [Bernardetiaceae bacterium]
PTNGCPEPLTIAKGPAWSFAGSSYTSPYKRSGFTSFSPFVPVFNDLIIQPVEFISFAATAVGELARLDWATAWEHNADYFEVQRSPDGENWQPLGQVKATGQANTRTNYSFWDTQPLNGINYYRIAQVDFDQTTQYTRMVSLDFTGETALAFKLFPNPTTDGHFELLLPPEKSGVELSVVDVTGRTVHQQYFRQASGRLPIAPAQKLAKGVYTVRLVRAGRAWVGKLVVQ